MGAGKLRQGCCSGRESTARPRDIFAVLGGTWVGWVGPQRRQHREGLPDPTPPHTHQSRPWQPTTFPAKTDTLDRVLDSCGGGRRPGTQGSGVPDLRSVQTPLTEVRFPKAPG